MGTSPTNKEIYAAVMARDIAERATRETEPSDAERLEVMCAAAPDMAEALRQIYEDIPNRPNMTEAGRVAMIAEIARAALAKAGL